MTTPLITTITPSEGLASGRQRVIIRGMHFRESLPGQTQGDYQRTVMVTFDGVEAEAVVPIARYRLDVVTPRYLGSSASLPDAVDVVVTNLDDDGNPIGGESVAAADGYTYRRPDMAANPGNRPYKSTLEAVTLELIRTLQRGLIHEVVPATDPDWSRDPSSGLTAVAQLPAILLDGPEVEESRKYRYSRALIDARDEPPLHQDEVTVDARPFTAMLRWSIVLVADRKHEAVRLLNAAVRFFDRRPYLRIPIAQGSSTYVEVDLFIEEWRTDDRPQDRVFSYTSTIVIEPVYLDDDYGIANQGVPVDDVTGHVIEDSDEFLQLEEDSHG